MTSGEEVQGGDGGRENEREVRKKVREREREKSNFLQPPHLFDCNE